jgi:PAS domain S-box-containing protein
MAAMLVRSFTAGTDGNTSGWSTWLVLTALFFVTEYIALSFYDESVRWGLSSGEAILLPILVTLSSGQTILAAAIAMGSARAGFWKATPVKEAFNVAQYGVAAGLAAALWALLNDGTGTFTIRNAFVATFAVVLFAVLTHIFVALGFRLARRGSVLEFLNEVRPAALINLGGSITLGLFFTAALLTATWTIVLFPLPLTALYFGYRAMVSQSHERERVERLHAASQALAGAPDLGPSLKGFLIAVAEMVSAQEALVLLEGGKGVQRSGVRAGELIADMEQVDGDSFLLLMEQFRSNSSPVLLGTRLDDKALLAEAPPGTNMIAVPILVDDLAVGCLIVQERSGAGEFNEGDGRLLQALANELSLAIGARRLSDEVSVERERFRLMVEAVKDYAIFMVDTQGRIISWNAGATRITGFEAAEIIGQHVTRFYPHEDAGTTLEKELEKARDTGTSEVEGWRVRKDGSRYLAQVLMSPIWDASGDLQGYAKVIRDVTERAQALEEKESLQAQLHQAQKLETVGRLAGGIAHDFNNLLSVMLNYSSFVMKAVEGDQALKEDVAEIKLAAERAASLTRQLLIFSRREIPTPQVVDLNTVIAGVEKLLKRSIGEDVVLRVDLEEPLHRIKADPGQIEQVLLNLAINARDAMSGGGTITITTSTVDLDKAAVARKVGLTAGPHVRLQVMDTGSGMSPDVRERAFEPFFTTKPKEVGTGLGLATVYGIIQQSKGHIAVDSTEGIGTTFTIHIPVTVEEIQAPRSDAETPVEGGGETVLIVEDQSAVRALAHRILTNHGYNVMVAASGNEALETALEGFEPVRLLLSDVVMPHMSGIELSRRMSQLVPDIKVLYMSGYNDAMVPTGGGVKEDVVLLQKPFTEDELLLKVREVLDS